MFCRKCYLVNTQTQVLDGYRGVLLKTFDDFKKSIYDNKGLVSGIYVPTSGAGAEAWQHYESGLLKIDCSNLAKYDIENNIQTNHVVNIVGYGTQAVNEGSPNYLVIRNSWGNDWGQKGVAKISFDSLCGMGGQDGYKLPNYPATIVIDTTVRNSSELDYGCADGDCGSDCISCVRKDPSNPPNSVSGISIMLIAMSLILLL